MTRAATFLYSTVCLFAASRILLAADWHSDWESALQKARSEGNLSWRFRPAPN